MLLPLPPFFISPPDCCHKQTFVTILILMDIIVYSGQDATVVSLPSFLASKDWF